MERATNPFSHCSPTQATCAHQKRRLPDRPHALSPAQRERRQQADTLLDSARACRARSFVSHSLASYAWAKVKQRHGLFDVTVPGHLLRHPCEGVTGDAVDTFPLCYRQRLGKGGAGRVRLLQRQQRMAAACEDQRRGIAEVDLLGNK